MQVHRRNLCVGTATVFLRVVVAQEGLWMARESRCGSTSANFFGEDDALLMAVVVIPFTLSLQ